MSMALMKLQSYPRSNAISRLNKTCHHLRTSVIQYIISAYHPHFAQAIE